MDLLDQYASVLEGSPGTEFRVFSRHGVPLLLLPEDGGVAAKTIDLYLPQSVKAKVARRALKILNGCGLLGFLPAVTTAGAYGGELCGYLLCNPVHGARAIAVSSADDGFRIRKIAARSASAPIRAEFDALKRLQGRPGVPAVYGCGAGEAFYFEMEYLEAAPVRSLEDERVGRLLESWRSPDDPGKALVHGDFALWNLRGRGGDLVAIDWEWSREGGPAGFDLVYALVREASLVHHLSGADADAEVVRRIRHSKWMTDYLSKSGRDVPALLAEVREYIGNRPVARDS